MRPRTSLTLLFGLLCFTSARAAKTDDAAARRQAISHSYGTYGANLRTTDGHIDSQRLLSDLTELHANTYNWLIAGAATDWDDLHTFLPLARKHGIRVWVTLLPPSESSPKGKHSSEPFHLDFENRVSGLAALPAREPHTRRSRSGSIDRSRSRHGRRRHRRLLGHTGSRR